MIDDSGNVVLMDEAKRLPSILALSKKDKTKEQNYFKDALTYIYHVYVKKHMYSFLSFKARQTRIIEQYLPNRTSEKFESDQKVQDVIKEFIEQQYTPNEMFYESIKEDLDSMKEYIRKIPLVKKEKIKRMLSIDDGTIEIDQTDRTIYLDVDIEIDNSKEKFDAMKRGKELMELEITIKDLVIQEERNNKNSYNTFLESGILK